MAVPTMDWSSDDMNMPAISAPKMSQTVRGVRTISGLSVAGAPETAMAMRGPRSFGAFGQLSAASGTRRRTVVRGSVGDDRAQLGDDRREVLFSRHIGR